MGIFIFGHNLLQLLFRSNLQKIWAENELGAKVAFNGYSFFFQTKSL